jgi:hypothetical protein
MAVYGFVASVLPVWLLLEPRDYLSTYVELVTFTLLVIGVFVVYPDIKFQRSRNLCTAGVRGCLRAGVARREREESREKITQRRKGFAEKRENRKHGASDPMGPPIAKVPMSGAPSSSLVGCVNTYPKAAAGVPVPQCEK